ncbi:MAG: filamentous hemagglutinin N-terminal domain-containing protein, partial [Oceanospirillaceae bacterium]|nr:filamentous hemagglutinin N-terminal domain-containing protein [Oceanospirillaceae bacterium]
MECRRNPFTLNRLAKVIRSVITLGTAGAVAISLPAMAGPSGGVVTAGSGSVQQSGSTTTVNQNTNSLVVDWDSFNVGTNELVQFKQPSSSSVVLNNILDQSPSLIRGSIQANGRVFLSNPNGIVFGSEATVNVNALIATSHKIDSADFMNADLSGQYELLDVDGQGIIVNHGLLQAASGGSINLIGDRVENHGVILANKGQVNLAVGSVVTLDFDGDGLLAFSVDADQLSNIDGSETAILNNGSIEATDGAVYLTARAAKDVFSKVVNNQGIIKATGIDTSGGVIRITGTGGDVYNSGDLIASSKNAKGGSIDVLGDRVAIMAGTIDVSGATGGGSVRIGGDYQGKNAAIQNASDTHVEVDVVINASATENGDGGRVILWADGATVFKGEIMALGGEFSGDGGFAEVSGKEFLAYRGVTDLRAKNGEIGTLLLDPENIEISGGLTGNEMLPDDPENDPGHVVAFSVDVTGTSIINAGELAAALNGGNVELQAHNDITVSDIVDSSRRDAGNLILEAGRDINIDAAIILESESTLTLIAASSNATPVATDPINTHGDININASISARTIDLQVESRVSMNPIVLPGSINQTAGVIETSNLLVSNMGLTTSLDLANEIDSLTVASHEGGNFSLTNTIDLQLNGEINTATSDFTLLNGNNAVTLTASVNQITAGTFTVEAKDIDGIADLNGPINASMVLRPDQDSGTINLAVTDGVDFTLTSGDIEKLKTAEGEITLGRSAGRGRITLGSNLDLAGKTVTIQGGQLSDSVNTLSADSLTLILNSNSGANQIKTNVGSLAIDSSNGSDAANRTIVIDQAGDMAIGAINANDGDVTIETDGAITDSNAAALNVTANTLTITGNNLVGTAADDGEIDTSVTTLDFTTAETHIKELNGVTVNDSTLTGALDLTTGAGELSLNHINA